MERALSGRVLHFHGMFSEKAGNPARQNTQEQIMPEAKDNNRKYVSFSHTFSDPWSGENAEDALDVTLTFRFSKPTRRRFSVCRIKRRKIPARRPAICCWKWCIPTTNRRSRTRWRNTPALPPALPRPSSRAWAFLATWETSGAGRLRPGRRPDSVLAARRAGGKP